jgi:hypothetical protein
MTEKKCIKCNNALDPFYEGRCWYCENRAQSFYYSCMYRCANHKCLSLNSALEVVDGDEDYVILQCRWCGTEFRIDGIMPDDPNDYDAPTAEDDQKMIDEYHLRRFGEY